MKKINKFKYSFFTHEPADSYLKNKLNVLLLQEKELKNRVTELEKREAAYLEMLTQADDMWAEMEGGYKKKINEAKSTEIKYKEKVKQNILPLMTKVIKHSFY